MINLYSKGCYAVIFFFSWCLQCEISFFYQDIFLKTLLTFCNSVPPFATYFPLFSDSIIDLNFKNYEIWSTHYFLTRACRQLWKLFLGYTTTFLLTYLKVSKMKDHHYCENGGNHFRVDTQSLGENGGNTVATGRWDLLLLNILNDNKSNAPL